jgi:hypothetical protein
MPGRGLMPGQVEAGQDEGGLDLRDAAPPEAADIAQAPRPAYSPITSPTVHGGGNHAPRAKASGR